ncbi:MAG: rhodanese-like domain-containing protein [Candidatus Promineifilaceae bacterium]
MPNPYGAPEISVQEVAEKRENGDDFILMDVREAYELDMANLGEGVTLVPLSQLAARQLDALPSEVADNKDAEIVAFCHTGVRSGQVTMWLRQQGWANVLSMAGGINAYARQIDPDVGIY